MMAWSHHGSLRGLLPLVLLALLVGACMQLDIQSEFTEQTSATHTFRFVVSKEMLRSMGVSESDFQ
jgi:hypothetical protein